MKKTLFLIALTAIFCGLNAQKAPIKFGKLTVDELKKEVYEIDSAAPAVILCDYGTSKFDFSETHGFRLAFKRTTRIKILNEEGLEYGDFKISLYRNRADKEAVGHIKGLTYNLIDGKIDKSKLTSDLKHVEEFSDNITYHVVSFPVVKVGSVVEIEYTIYSPFLFNLQDWFFQYDIPALHSEYRVEIPEYFNYKKKFKGYVALSTSEKELGSGTLRIKTSSNQGYGGRTSSEMQTINYTAEKNRWIAQNVPAFVKEPYLNSVDNYITKIEFELESHQFPGSMLKNYTKSWEAINKELLTDDNFGADLEKKYYKQIIEEIHIKDTSPEKIIYTVLKYMQDNYEWNLKNRIFTDEFMQYSLKNGEGNSADINIMLVGLLRELGFKSNPVIISTRSHGIIQPGSPMLSDFNFVIAEVEVNDNKYLLDATDNESSINILPVRCLNDKGRIISERNSGWVELKGNSGRIVTKNSNYTIDEDILKGTSVSKKSGYGAYFLLKSMNKFSTTEDYINDIQKNNANLSISDYNYKIVDSINYNISESYNCEIKNSITSAGNLLYFNPILNSGVQDNPFKLKERKYPVDFPYPESTVIINTFTIPEGYVIEELPEPLKIALPENGGYYLYNIKQIQNKLQLISKLILKKTEFIGEEYAQLFQFYEMMVEKNNSQVILKKQL